MCAIIAAIGLLPTPKLAATNPVLRAFASLWGGVMHVVYWWVCGLCADRMQESTNIRAVEHDRDAHLANNHPGVTIESWRLQISHWVR